MQFEEQIVINCAPEKVFSIYSDVSAWPTWDPDCKSAELDGAFVAGATGTIYPHGGPKSKLNFTEVILNKGFKVYCKLPLCKMKFDHELTPFDGKTKAIHRVTFEGFFAPIFGRLIGGSLKKSLPNALLGLKNRAEK